MKNLDALYEQLVAADAKGDIQSAKQLQTEMRTLLSEDSSVATTPPQQNVTNVDSLYEQLVEADAKGDIETAKQLQTQMRSLLFKEPEVTEQPKTTQPPKEVPKIPINVMGQKFTAEEYAKYSGMPIAAKPGEKAKGAFSGTFGQGIYNLAADAVISYGRTLGNPEEAEQIANRLREYAANTYTSANKSFREDPLTKIQELLGNSAPYMIGPVMGAIGSTALGATGLVAGVAPTVVSATQFLGSNLQRQIDANNIDLADTNLLTAGATTIPQALLDNIGFRYIPGIKNIFGAAGKKISDETAKQIFNQSLLTSVGKKVLSSSVAATKGATVEGITETAQQVFERLQAGLSITNKEARDEYLESFIGGYIAGKAIGLPGALLTKEPSAAAPTTEPPEPTTAEPKTERLSKQQQIKNILKDLEQEADQVNKAKVAADSKLKTAQQKQVVSEAADLESTLPDETGVITPTTLTSWGIRKGSIPFKTLEGVDASTPEGRYLVDKTLEAYTGKLNEQAVNTFTSLLDKKAEAPDAGIDLGTTTISDAVLGGSKYGTPGGTQGRFGPTTDISGGVTGIPETGEKTSDSALEETKPLETIKGPEARAKAPTLAGGERLLTIQELLNDPNPQQRKAARRKFIDLFRRDETNELIKEGAKLEREERAKYAKLKKTQYPVVDQSTNLANILSTLRDKPSYLIEDLRNPDVIDAERQELNQHARDYLLAESLRNKYKKRMTPEEVAALEQEGETIARKEKPLSQEDFKDLQDKFLADNQDKDLYHKVTPIESNEWFKNATLKNEAGLPLKLFHGTTKEVNTLRSSKDGALGAGIYLTPDPEFAGRYAEQEGGNILPVYTNIKNPLVIKSEMGKGDPMVQALIQLGISEDKAADIVEKAYETKGYISKEVQSRAQKQGYDGIVQYKNGQISEVVAFNAAQVKSALEPLESKAMGTPEGQAIVNTTKPANTFGQALNIIKKQHFNKLNPVEKILQNLFETLPNVLKGKYKVMGMPKGEYGKYTSILNETIISPKAGTDTIYHEGTHAATVWAIRRHVTTDKNGRPKAKGNSVVGQQLVDIFDAAEVAAMQEEVTFGEAFKNMEEFVSYAFNNKNFQRFLAKQRSVAPTPSPMSSLWLDLMNAFNKLLGLDISDSLMSDIVALAPELMTGERPDNLKDFGQDKPLYNKDEEEKELNKLIEKTGQKRKVKTPKPTTVQRFKEAPFKTLMEQITNFRKFAFDFEFAINKKILDAMKKSGVNIVELAKAAIELNLSQVLYASETARAFLERGSISYDPKIFKFLITESDTSMKKIKEAISDIAKKRNINVSTLFEAASTAFIAKRSRGLNKSNQNSVAKARALVLQGKTEAAKKELKNNFKLVHMSDAEIAAGFKILEKYPELNEVFDMWNDVRAKVLDFANTTGLLDKNTVERFLEAMDYVPFYRVFEDANGQIEVKGRKDYINGLLDPSKEPKFEGSYREVNNVFDNMENWANYIIMKGIKNNAAAVKLRYYQEYLPDDIKKITGQKYSGNTNSVQIHENVIVNGEEKNILNRYEFQGYDAKAMVDGFTGLEPVTIAGLKYFSNFSHFLRQSIVLYPFFSLKQIVMDTIAAVTLSGVNYGILIPVQVLKEIALTPLGLSKARNRLKAVIAVGRADPSKEFNRLDNIAADEAKKYKTYEAFKKAVLSPFSALAMASDNVIRQAIYAQTMLETGNEALAVHRAFEIINFKRTGSGQVFNIMRQLVPFTGASLQALHVSGATIFGEGITPGDRVENIKRYLLNGAQIAIATLMYSILMSDDDEYKKLDPSERDSFFILPNGYKIPMRTDYSGLFFKVFTEHVYQRWVAESEDNKKMNKALLAGLIKATSIPSSMPVLIKPLIESRLNTNLYTNRPIVGQSQQSIEPEFQYSPKNTTQLALALGEASETSPLIWDNVLKSVLGSTSQVLNMFTENMIADLRGETLPKKSFKETLMMFPDIKSFVTQKLGNRELNDLYELKDEVDKHYNTYKKLEKLAVDAKGQKEFDDYYTKNQESINVSRQLNPTDSLLAQLRTYENQIRTDSNISPEDKRKELDRLETQKRELLNYPVEREDGSITNYIQSLRERAGFNKEKVVGVFGGEE